jgi:hypothetical protein
MSPRLMPAVLAAVGATLVCGVLATHAELEYRRASMPPESDLLYLPRTEVMRAASLGHTELVADLVWVRAVVYAGEQIGHHGRMRWLDRYLETIVALDGAFKRPYKWAGVITMYNGRVITNEMVRGSNHYLSLAETHFPDDWEFPFMLGCNYLYELRTNDLAQKEEWRRKGAEYIRRAALLRGSPPWLPLLAATLYTRAGQDDVAIRHLEEVYASTEDPKIREQVKWKLMSLKASSDARHIEELRARIDEGRKAWAPYAPVDLYILVGPPRKDQTLDKLVAEPLAEAPTQN